MALKKAMWTFALLEKQPVHGFCGVYVPFCGHPVLLGSKPFCRFLELSISFFGQNRSLHHLEKSDKILQYLQQNSAVFLQNIMK
jgi:hypothetical protein